MDEVAEYWEQVVKINLWQQKRISALVIKNLFGTLTNKKITILGFSFKANTNDTRESPSIIIAKELLKEGAELNFYDPKVEKNQILSEFEDIKDSKIIVFESVLVAAEGADAVIVMTDWEEFQYLDWISIYKVMRKPAWVFDTRICLDREKIKNIGFNLWTLGRI